MPFEPLESKRVYERAEKVADQVWEVVVGWEWFAKKTVGAQLARAADSIGAHIAESAGRFHPGEVRTFLYYARGSLQETRFWLRRAEHRSLLSPERLRAITDDLDQLAREINQCIAYQRTRSSTPTQPPIHPTT